MSTDSATREDREATAPSSLGDNPAIPPGSILAGRYVVDRMIGEGGMGEVYLARHEKIDKLVAIKMLAPEQARRPKTVQRFLQEAKAASKIRHENIVDITDFGEDDGAVFLAMEFLDGEDLRFLLQREGRLKWARARAIIIQLLEGLGAAHEVGVVHRDVKPHNCFISPRETNPEFLKIIDFGIAKVRDGSEEALTRTGAIMGTAEYMSPEQGQGAELDGRSDLYSAGVILYRALTGRVPFKAGNAMAILYQHVHTAPVPPSEACPEAELGTDVDLLLAKALAKEPEERFSTAAEFIAALRAIDDPSATRIAAIPKQSRVGIFLAAGALAVVAAGVTVWALQGEEPESQKVVFVQTGAGSPAGADAGVQAESSANAEPGAAAESAEDSLPEEPTPPQAVPTVDEGAEPVAPAEPTPATGDEPETAEGEPATQLPVRRSKRHVRSVMERLAGKVKSCGKKAGLFPGEKVKVSVTVAPGGRPSKVSVSGTHAAAGVACITKAVKGARFSAAQRTQSVDHRFTI